MNIPSEITTERLLLRVPMRGDGALMIDAIRASLPELKPWLPWAHDGYSLQDANDWCERSATKFFAREEASYLIFHRETSRYMGSVGSYLKDREIQKFDIGYWLASREVGRGYMTEAVKAVTQMTFDCFNARRVELRIDRRNSRSCRVADRAGFEPDGLNAEAADSNEQIYAMCRFNVPSVIPR